MERTVNREWFGSKVTETVKNGILTSIDTSKDLAFYADTKYIKVIKIGFTYEKLRAWEIFPDFRERRETPPKSQGILAKSHHQTQCIKETYYRPFQLLYRKTWNFEIFFCLPEERSRMCVYLVFFCFVLFSPQGWLHQNSGPRRSRECSIERQSKVLEPFLFEQKDWRVASSPLKHSSPPTPFFLQVVQHKFWDSHLVKHSGNIQ